MTKYNICNNKNECIKTPRLNLNQAMKRNKTKREIRASNIKVRQRPDNYME